MVQPSLNASRVAPNYQTRFSSDTRWEGGLKAAPKTSQHTPHKEGEEICSTRAQEKKLQPSGCWSFCYQRDGILGWRTWDEVEGLYLKHTRYLILKRRETI